MTLPAIKRTKTCDLVGRTIVKVIDNDGSMLKLRLDDDSIYVAQAELDSCDYAMLTDDVELDCWDLVHLGFMTREQAQAHRSEEQANNLKQAEDAERATYERLRAKFEAPKSEGP